MASGKTRLNEIKQATGLEGATAYLDTLQQLQLVERRVPVTENQPQKCRRGVYRFKDHCLRFWFRFVQPHLSQLERGGTSLILKNQVLPQLDPFTGLVFEEICLQFAWHMALAGKLPFIPNRIENWWRNDAEVDLVALGEQEALLFERKWASRPLGVDILTELEQKKYPIEAELENRSIQFALCSRSGFTQQLIQQAAQRNDLVIFDLDDIVNSK